MHWDETIRYPPRQALRWKNALDQFWMTLNKWSLRFAQYNRFSWGLLQADQTFQVVCVEFFVRDSSNIAIKTSPYERYFGVTPDRESPQFDRFSWGLLISEESFQVVCVDLIARNLEQSVGPLFLGSSDSRRDIPGSMRRQPDIPIRWQPKHIHECIFHPTV